MAEINWNDVYKNYLTETNDPYKAIEYTVFGRLTGSKKVPTSYTKEQWYEYEAPDYWSAINYAGDDRLATYTRDKLKSTKSFNELLGIAKEATDKGILSGSYGQVDYYTDLKDLWNQKSTAEKRASSTSASWWKQYGLPDPSKRFDSLKTYAEAVKRGSKPAKPTNIYSPAFDYLTTETTKYKAQLEKKGIKGADLAARVADFSVGLAGALDKKMTSAGFTPFLIAAQQRIKARG